MASANTANIKPTAVNYGVDDPQAIARWNGRAGWAAGLGLFVYIINRAEYPAPSLRILFVLLLIALACAAVGWLKKSYSQNGKLQLREQLLDSLSLTGTEKVLDVGCGAGLLTIGAAKRLKTGKVTGIDVDENELATAKENAKLEGVGDRVRFENGFAKSATHKLVFPDNNFDVVVCNRTFGQLADDNDRKQILSEMHRVLAPGGRVLIFDSFDSGFAAQLLHGAGAKNVTLSSWSFPWLIPHRSVMASK